MTRVVDASVVVAALIDGGASGQWAEQQLMEGPLAAPALMPFEAANVLRRAALAGHISGDTASLAHRDLSQLPVETLPYAALADRAWELRETLTTYDAAYVALAEALGCPLVTLDRRLACAPGLTCDFETPGAQNR